MRWKYQLPEIHNLLSQAFCTFPQTDIQKERNKHCNSKMFLISPCSISAPPSTSRIRHSPIKSMAVNRSNSASQRINGIQSRISLLIALASQTSSLSQKLLTELAGETAKYVFPKRIIESRNLEEALMSVPDLETVKFNVLKRNDQYEIREVEPYFVAEATMPGKNGFDLNGASQSFNKLAEYLFGKNTKKESMAMTTPAITRRTQSDGEKMEMTTPVITKRSFWRHIEFFWGNWRYSGRGMLMHGVTKSIKLDNILKSSHYITWEIVNEELLQKRPHIAKWKC
ncbi:heme-binding-like protein At3g10130, chloroplastic isoform X5 [Lycium ferocissimum]|uniref:heme-binding-like protein At3g10130, chloroplastic isoform X5 n=1 Tax=Lycium ferocissimum TaxID=112874 RepID=UPI00281683CD|nr:heme-binding-like protein At3g10130, chloroplastic isoform X5 [Lycium ferocissimum]